MSDYDNDRVDPYYLHLIGQIAKMIGTRKVRGVLDEIDARDAAAIKVPVSARSYNGEDMVGCSDGDGRKETP